MKGILVNIFGGIMRCDIIADGIVAAAREVSLNVPLVVRLEGTNVQQGKDILASSGLPIIAANDLGDAAKKIVAEVKAPVPRDVRRAPSGNAAAARSASRSAGEPLLTMACHCTGCQHMTASAFSLSEASIRRIAFRRDTRRDSDRRHVTDRRADHEFCDYCKSWLYTEPRRRSRISSTSDSTMFDEPRRACAVRGDVTAAKGLPWRPERARRTCYDKLPAMDEWPSFRS